MTLNDQYYSPNVWLWNLSPDLPEDWPNPNLPPLMTPTLDQSWSDSPSLSSNTTLEGLKVISAIGSTDGQVLYVNPFGDPEILTSGNVLLSNNISSPKWILGIGTRPFHPKQRGHFSIKQSIIKAIQAAKVPGLSSE